MNCRVAEHSDKMKIVFCLFTIFVHFTNGQVSLSPVYMCDSKIYCQGPILEAVNRLGIYNDSKYYVDMPLKKSQDETLKAFKERFPDESKIEAKNLKQFLDEYFAEPVTLDSELIRCTPSDWKPEPEAFSQIKDTDYRQWAKDLQAIWSQLCRKINDSVLADFDKNSLIYVPNNFIVAGGRFREYYYWDSYWIVKGLLVSGMHETVKNMLRNFAFLIGKIGFIPNGGRVYYLRRSQPPFFIPMVYEYYKATGDTQLVRELLPSMETELKFWRDNRTVSVRQNGKDYTVYQYRTTSNAPRPESYKEDSKTAAQLNDATSHTIFGVKLSWWKKLMKPHLYQDLASAAESGHDFSSRWFANLQDLTTIRITDILPVDLNALLCWNHRIMHQLNKATGNDTAAKYYSKRSEEIQDILEALFYNSTVGSWFDVDMRNRSHLQYFYPSNAVPLFTQCYDTKDTMKAKNFHQYLQKSGALSFPSGIPSSLRNTGQQWDLPNGWPPHNHMIIEGLRKSGRKELEEHAFKLAESWLHVNYMVYKKSGKMFEKFNVTDSTYHPGGGGEYNVQIGFGWTNGVVLDLLKTYGGRVSARAS